MAFPETILPLQVDLSLDGITWTDVSDDVLYENKIRITRGRRDWGQQVDASRCSLALKNTDGKYTPQNPRSPYFGQIGRNTPIRVSVTTGSVALDLPGEADDYASTPDTTALDITGDIDIRFDATLVNWVQADYPSGGSLSYPRTELVAKRAAGQISWALYMSQGRPYFEWSTDGSSTNWAWASKDAPLSSSGRLAVRVTLDVDDGAGSKVITFYTAETIDGPWVELDGGAFSGTTSIHSSTAPLRIGAATEQTTWQPALGRVHAVQVRAGIDGTVVANPDFTAQTSGTTSFADSAGLTWSLAGNSEITNRKVRFVGEVSSWNPRWDTGGHYVVTDIEASGALRRLGQGAVPTKSPFYRELTNPGRVAAGIVAYWPLEDGADAARFASAVDGHPAMTKTAGVTPAAYSSWVASGPLPTVDAGSMRVTVPSYTLGSTSLSSVGFFALVPAAGTVSTQRLMSLTQGGTAAKWSIWVNTSGNIAIRTYDVEGTQTHDSGFSTDSINGLEKYLVLRLTQSGANVSYDLTVVDIAGTSPTAVPDNAVDYFQITGTATSVTTGVISQIRFGEDAGMNGTAIGHVAVGNTATAFNATAGVMVGWNAEEAASRTARIGAEEELHSYPTSAGDEKCGTQPAGTALQVMAAAGEVDEGILAEQRSVLGLRFVTRASMYNQKPALVLDYTGDDGLVAPLAPTDDDQGVTNDVTVSRTSGSSARLTQATGALSTMAPPDGIGLYDTSYTLNLLDDTQPLQHAGWRLHLGTWDETRFPQITVNLANAPASIEAAASVDTGSRIEISNPPVWLPPDTLSLLVQGYTEILDQYTWTLTYNCSPAGPFTVAVESSLSPLGRLDTDGSALAEDLTADETAVDVFVTDGPRWVPAAPTLIPNYDFEQSLDFWTANGCTISREATPDHAPFLGSWSMKLVPDGVAQFPNAGCDMVPVVEGREYTLSGWQVCETSRLVDLNLNWFDAGGNYMSTSANGQTVTAGEWAWFTLTATAPAGAAFGNGAPTVPDFPPSTDVLWSDMVTLRPAYSGEMPEEYPYDVRVGGETMRVTAATSAVYDTFDRTVAGGWGTAESGAAWTVVGSAADYSVSPGVAAVAQPAEGIAHLTLQEAPSADVDLYVDCAVSALATGSSLYTGPLVRATDNDNHYMARIDFTTANGITLTLRKRVAGAETVLGTYTAELTHTAGTYYRVRLQAIGTTVRTKLWLATDQEPDRWHITATDSSHTGAASIGTRSFRNTGNTNASLAMRFANFDLANPQTLTVIRSLNGVSKTHTAGTAVAVAHPAVIAL
ncbi:hypothetical protein ACFUTR_23240 [Streptomyces sp. NPDC057367]|uniref:hypothetical protein n=1 Tax=Streptomyces sp. NPDC057367 TaxID=3346108 RepID=UPI00362D35A1